MNQASMARLEYNAIHERLCGFTVSAPGLRLAEKHRPSSIWRQASLWQRETAEAESLLAAGASVPLSAMEGIEPFLALLGKGRIYDERELSGLSAWLGSVAQMKRYMEAKSDASPLLSGYASSMRDCPELRAELDRCIRGGWLHDQASPELSRIRRAHGVTEDRIRRKLDASLAKYRNALQEAVVSQRSGRFVLAVRREHRKLVPGTVWDESASGQTLFVEPADIADLQAELSSWKSAEEQERQRILAGLSALAEEHGPQLGINLETMAMFDFILARGKLALSYDGTAPVLEAEPAVRIVSGRHPLLGKQAVPIDAELGLGWDQLYITGPNTGGKTLALKTIGLFVLMAQAGLFLPAAAGTAVGLFDDVLADVGDGQSIEQSLSTFSAHLAVLREVLDKAGRRTLVLLDELAAGTDPGEGIALSIAVLEELGRRGSKLAVTTHFNEIKAYAARTGRCMNARMAFDPESLQPLYRLEPGEAGDSYALAIAKRYGLPESILDRAEQLRPQRAPELQRLPARAENPAAEEEAGIRPPAVQEQERAAVEPVGSKRPDSGSLQGGVGRLHHGHKDGAATTASMETAGSGRSEPEHASDREAEKGKGKKKMPLRVGDCVWIYPLRRTGIVFREADERGEVGVQVQKEKRTFNRKRLALHIEKEQLYPGGEYDLDIVFDSKENRKARKLMSRKHVDGLKIETPGDGVKD
ncbi:MULTISPECIES: DNA mismatch repair protein MutS [unclassified Paenibacillus]|uniref:endonuclease MutS2 n=1 Tax=unclassified Paenibacillus TaxID=185978 RepID=UPI000954E629|nr:MULTISPECIES: DNA mismatch repair protein MutS [unclassified Paenibacillus]SIQ40899.1 dsDNA-specific endonuclease/ATPase MutS2 [Paenibacillus sp. RU4X]SIQ63079.1 dsDNA-specific endonuclease/ATPase MutS2 [Paenibacillus sp. RU4T]